MLGQHTRLLDLEFGYTAVENSIDISTGEPGWKDQAIYVSMPEIDGTTEGLALSVVPSPHRVRRRTKAQTAIVA